jgi:hypothetical protein
MRLIPEAAHCDSVGHVLYRVMCIDKLKLLCTYWMMYIPELTIRKAIMSCILKIRSSIQTKLHSRRFQQIEFCFCFPRFVAQDII